MVDVMIGTCSWSDRALLSSGWYPGYVKDAQSRLKYYSDKFSTVEVDSTFYAIPSPETVYAWASRTPSGFRFNMKAYGIFTFHAVSRSSLPTWVRDEVSFGPDAGNRVKYSDIPKSLRLELWNSFVEVIKPLQKMDKMGYLLFQLPPWAGYSSRMVKYIEKIGRISPPFRAAIEVRNRSWLDKSNRKIFLDLLKEYNLAYVIVDEPELDWTVPGEIHTTATWGSVIRFHGRNRDAWMKRGATVQERFRYLYSEMELIPWKNSIIDISSRVDVVYCMFNNCYRNYSVTNAGQMEVLLGLKSPPDSLIQQDLGLSEL